MNRDSDKELIKRSIEGDINSFGTLVKRYESSVAAIIKSMLGDSPESQDVGQEVFISFYKNLKYFRHQSGLKTYLVRIAINLSLNELKRRKRNSSRYISLDDHGYEHGTSDHERREIMENIEFALNQLDNKMKAVVVLRMLEGYSTKETADILDIPQGTVLSRLSRAQDILRGLLKGKF